MVWTSLQKERQDDYKKNTNQVNMNRDDPNLRILSELFHGFDIYNCENITYAGLGICISTDIFDMFQKQYKQARLERASLQWKIERSTDILSSKANLKLKSDIVFQTEQNKGEEYKAKGITIPRRPFELFLERFGRYNICNQRNMVQTCLGIRTSVDISKPLQ